MGLQKELTSSQVVVNFTARRHYFPSKIGNGHLSMIEIIKYPRTMHLVGSALQTGDPADRMSMTKLREIGSFRFEEKLDGANCAVSFHPESFELVLQSRGHPLVGGPRERQFDILKAWASVHESAFREVLAGRYIMYGEWTAAVHSVFYDQLPHYFNEFDVFDRETRSFLSTPARRSLLDGLPIVSVPVIHEGWVSDKDLSKLVRKSLYKSSSWRDNMRKAAEAAGVDPERLASEIDAEDMAEGLYLKHEDDETGTVIGRYKFVRRSFVQRIVDEGVHWSARPIVFNSLADGVDLYAATTVEMTP